MERQFLTDRLARGDSIESIARAVGLSASTVAYWVGKHSLESSHAERHRARGPLDRATVSALVDEGLSVRQLADRLQRSTATVRHWLATYELTTRRARQLAEARSASAHVAEGTTFAVCPKHGLSRFGVRPDKGSRRCLACRSEHVIARRRRVKATLVAEAGGRCVVCGYDRWIGALEFHHVDASKKSFALSREGVTRSIAKARAEAAKCVLLCANCHAEVEAGAATLPELPAIAG